MKCLCLSVVVSVFPVSYTHLDVYKRQGPYLLGVLIQRKTEKNLIEYLTPRLFDKLEIKPLEAEFCPKGYVFGAGGLQMNVRELGKFGQLYLQRGKWKGEQILSEKWIEESTKKQVECGDYNNSQVDGYGYLFWHLKGDAYMANGKYGQYCICLLYTSGFRNYEN